ncbi:MAG: hypothetical protein IAE79_09610 [Anaerolinea sp.]|nr:hypothetical protein [Anaerolinea sp.]
MKRRERPYHSYLLRLWREDDNSESWRASLQDVPTGGHRGFGSLAELTAFLQEIAVQEQERPLSHTNSRSDI